MKPTDKMFQALEATAVRRLDPFGNEKRQRWLSFIDADADGCWIWTGTVNRTRGGDPGFPQFSMMGMGRKDASAITAMMVLWMPDQVQHSRRWVRRCGKRYCVRPACLTTDKRFIFDRIRQFDLEELRRLRAAGVPYKDCSRILGVPKSTLSGAASTHGMSEKRRPPLTLDERRALYDMWRAGVPQSKAGEKINRPVGTAKAHYQRFRRGENPWTLQSEPRSGLKNTPT